MRPKQVVTALLLLVLILLCFISLLEPPDILCVETQNEERAASPRTTRPTTISSKLRQESLEKTYQYGNRTILFYHFHKSGGHEVCRLAFENNEQRPGNNICLDGRWDTENAEKIPRIMTHQSCFVQEEALLKSSLTFRAVEFNWNWLQNCTFRTEPTVLTLSVVRHPASRLASQYLHSMKHRPDFQEYRNGLSPKQMLTDQPSNFFINNYQARRALNRIGSDALNTRPLSQAEIDHAVSLLDGIDVVLPLERLCEAGALLQRVFAWRVVKVQDTPINAFKRELWPEIEAQNKGDLAMWNAANAKLDRAMAELGVEPTNCKAVKYRYIEYEEVFNPQ